jgi:TPR repeat protein
MYHEGLGVKKDWSQAAFWFQKASEEEGPSIEKKSCDKQEEEAKICSQNTLGLMY